MSKEHKVPTRDSLVKVLVAAEKLRVATEVPKAGIDPVQAGEALSAAIAVCHREMYGVGLQAPEGE